MSRVSGDAKTGYCTPMQGFRGVRVLVPRRCRKGVEAVPEPDSMLLRAQKSMIQALFSRISGRNRHRTARVGLSFMAVALALAGCAENPHQVRAREYHRDAAVCRAQNTLGPEARANSGEVPALDAEIGIDIGKYLHCMERLGYQQDAKTDPLLKALSICGKAAARTVSGSRDRPNADFDHAAFRACLQQRGVEADGIEVPGAAAPR